jgi:hypothetical protein
MAFGCVYCVSYAPSGSSYQASDIVVFPCATPCQDFTMPSGPDAGTIFIALADECMEWPPEEGRSASFTTSESADKGVIHRASAKA